jgi:hypothetical protein
MADGQPEMIPMPNMPPQEVNQEDISRQLSAEEERATLLNFMGNMYGESKKMDGNIISPTNTLQRGKSEELKKQIEQVYTQPQQSVPQQVQAAPPVQSTLEEPQPSKLPISQPVSDEPIETNTDQLTLNFNISEKDDLLNRIDEMSKKISINMKEIRDLNNKIDKLLENITTNSLPIKRQTKKKSVDKKEEV